MKKKEEMLHDYTKYKPSRWEVFITVTLWTLFTLPVAIYVFYSLK